MLIIHRCYKAYTHGHNIVSQGARHAHTQRLLHIYRLQASQQWTVKSIWWPLRGGDGWGPHCKQGKVAGLLSRKLGVEGISGWSAKWQESESLEVKSLTHWVVCLNKCVRLALARTIDWPRNKTAIPTAVLRCGRLVQQHPLSPLFYTYMHAHTHCKGKS